MHNLVITNRNKVIGVIIVSKTDEPQQIKRTIERVVADHYAVSEAQIIAVSDVKWQKTLVEGSPLNTKILYWEEEEEPMMDEFSIEPVAVYGLPDENI